MFSSAHAIVSLHVAKLGLAALALANVLNKSWRCWTPQQGGG